MGKSKRKKKKKGQKGGTKSTDSSSSPMGAYSPAQSAAQAAAEAATRGLMRKNAELVQRLRSLKQSDRESACLAIAHVFSSENAKVAVRAAHELLRNGLMRALLPRLSDPSHVVRLHASGALRNLTSFGDPDISDILVREDALTPLLSCFRTMATSISTTLTGAASAPSSDLSVGEMVWICLDQILAVIINLCEDNEVATREVSSAANIKILLDWAFQGSNMMPDRVRNSAAKLLHILSDQNEPLAQLVLGQQDLPGRIIGLASQKLSTTSGVPASSNSIPWTLVLSLLGFLANVCSTAQQVQAIGQVASVFPAVLKHVLRQSSQTSRSDIRSSDATGASSAGVDVSTGGAVSSDHDSSMLMELGRVVDQQSMDKILALEVFTNLLLTLSEGEDNEEPHRSASQVACQKQMYDSMSRLVTDEELVTVVAGAAGIELAASAGLANAANSADSPHIAKDLSLQLHSRSMSCLGVVFEFIDAAALNPISATCWPSLFKSMRLLTERITTEASLHQAHESDDSLNFELLEATLGTAAGLMDKCSKFGIVLPFREPHAQLVRTIATAVHAFPPQCRSKAVTLIGAAGRQPHDGASHSRMSQVSMEVLTNDPILIPVAQALDVLFDLYCEDDAYRDTWIAMNIMGQLKTLAPLYRKRLSAEQTSLPGLEGAIVAEALHNLSRFIEYKMSTGW